MNRIGRSDTSTNWEGDPPRRVVNLVGHVVNALLQNPQTCIAAMRHRSEDTVAPTPEHPRRGTRAGEGTIRHWMV